MKLFIFGILITIALFVTIGADSAPVVSGISACDIIDAPTGESQIFEILLSSIDEVDYSIASSMKRMSYREFVSINNPLLVLHIDPGISVAVAYKNKDKNVAYKNRLRLYDVAGFRVRPFVC